MLLIVNVASKWYSNLISFPFDSLGMINFLVHVGVCVCVCERERERERERYDPISLISLTGKKELGPVW